MVIAALVACVVVSVSCFTWLVLDIRRERSNRLERARRRVRSILNDAYQQMSRSGGHDPFRFGGRDVW